MQLRFAFVGVAFCAGILLSSQALGNAAEWNPQAFAQEETLSMRTIGPEEGEYWFPVWLVVIDDQVYVRLGSRAAERVQKNKTAPQLTVKIADQQFDPVKGEEAPEMADAVAAAMAEKYWSDMFIRFFPHPLTLRLIPEEKR
ncbi:MAG: hypothetical protein AB7P69_19870 [Candidatus Binatia bacterium]